MTYVNCLGCGCVDCPSYSLAIDCPMCGCRCVPVPVADMLTAPYNDICNLYMHVPGMDIYISQIWSTYWLFHVWMCQLSLVWMCELSRIWSIYWLSHAWKCRLSQVWMIRSMHWLPHIIMVSIFDSLMCGCCLSQVWMYWLLQIWSLCWLCWHYRCECVGGKTNRYGCVECSR